MKSYDVIIVGARCAGAATAMLLARAGCSVLVVDRSALGRDTLSTHALMRGGVYQLSKWGLLDRIVAAQTPRIERTTFYYGEEAFPVDIPEKFGIDALYAPRRTVLDPILVDAARDAGADFVFGLRLVGLDRDDDGRVCGVVCQSNDGVEQRISAGLVIGADGSRSTVAKLVDAQTNAAFGSATASIYTYWTGLDFEGYHWGYGPEAAAGVIPTNDGLSCVFVALASSDMPAGGAGTGTEAIFDRVFERAAPTFCERVRLGRRVGGFKTAVGMPSHLKQSWGPGWALVGDAGYFKDPLTAHGITDALFDAELLALAVLEGGDGRALSRYQRQRDERATGMFELTERIASMSWSLPEVQQLHRGLSRVLQAEVETIAQQGRVDERAA